MKTNSLTHPISLLLVGIVLVSSLIAFTGCATTSPGAPVPLERVQSIARLAAYGSAKGFMISNPQTVPELERASAILDELVAASRWDISAAAQAIRAAGFKELNSEEGILAVEGAIMLSDLVAGRTIDLKQSDYAREAIIGAATGLRLALGKR